MCSSAANFGEILRREPPRMALEISFSMFEKRTIIKETAFEDGFWIFTLNFRLLFKCVKQTKAAPEKPKVISQRRAPGVSHDCALGKPKFQQIHLEAARSHSKSS